MSEMAALQSEESMPNKETSQSENDKTKRDKIKNVDLGKQKVGSIPTLLGCFNDLFPQLIPNLHGATGWA